MSDSHYRRQIKEGRELMGKYSMSHPLWERNQQRVAFAEQVLADREAVLPAVEWMMNNVAEVEALLKDSPDQDKLEGLLIRRFGFTKHRTRVAISEFAVALSEERRDRDLRMNMKGFD
jgi:hypothetical protein